MRSSLVVRIAVRLIMNYMISTSKVGSLLTYSPCIGQDKLGYEKIDEVEAEFVDLGSVAGRRKFANDKVIEDIDELSKHDVHERQDCTTHDHGDKSNRVQNPSFPIVVREDPLQPVRT